MLLCRFLINKYFERGKEVSNELKFSRKNGIYACFSNFYECSVTYDGIEYKNSEAAWQSLKVLDKEERKSFAELSGGSAKKLGRKVLLRPDWEKVKYDLMVEVCYAKFSQNLELKELLLSTGDDIIIENTTAWHDNIWGNCECPRCINKPGRNLLGKALMDVREKLKSNN